MGSVRQENSLPLEALHCTALVAECEALCFNCQPALDKLGYEIVRFDARAGIHQEQFQIQEIGDWKVNGLLRLVSHDLAPSKMV
jgi:hypothetical protein